MTAAPHSTPKEKPCTRCREVKPLDDFHVNNKRPDRRAYWCKQCFFRHRKEQAAFRTSLRGPSAPASKPRTPAFGHSLERQLLIGEMLRVFRALGDDAGQLAIRAVFAPFGASFQSQIKEEDLPAVTAKVKEICP